MRMELYILIEGVAGHFLVFFVPDYVFILPNSADPDEMSPQCGISS